MSFVRSWAVSLCSTGSRSDEKQGMRAEVSSMRWTCSAYQGAVRRRLPEDLDEVVV